MYTKNLSKELLKLYPTKIKLFKIILYIDFSKGQDRIG